MANLGNLYELGKGVPEDWVQSAKWLQRSAAFADPMGQSRLGDAYQFGMGVPQNRKLAIYWHYEASLLGNGHSGYWCGQLSKAGNFVGFRNEDERALFPGMPITSISLEPAGSFFHNSAERMAYVAQVRPRTQLGGRSAAQTTSGKRMNMMRVRELAAAIVETQAPHLIEAF